ncbi:MAG: hypothetical protein K2X66_01380 [Cyanobacteria bacterium]|nr:hypothetical protein [Cyanobacteriota bacterium]
MLIPPLNLNGSGKDPLSGGPVKPPSRDGYDPNADLLNLLGSPGSAKAPPSGEINPGNSKPGPGSTIETVLPKSPPISTIKTPGGTIVRPDGTQGQFGNGQWNTIDGNRIAIIG